jgi:hypothetical protein
MKKTIISAMLVSFTGFGVVGCASNNGTVLGSNATDMGVAGAAIGGLAAYGACKYSGANDKACQNVGLAGGVVGGVVGYNHGKGLDIAAAKAAAAQIQQETGYQPVIQTVQVQNQNGQTQQMAKSLELPIARVEMLSTKNGLNQKAIKAISRMDAMATQNNADFNIYIPNADTAYAPAIAGVAPHARIFQGNRPDYLLVVQPKQQG